MPIYEYECAKCGCFEHSQSIAEAPLARCPTCRRKVRKLLSASAFHLKGGGWYSDGYQRKNGAKAESTAPASSTPADSAAATKSETGSKKETSTKAESSTSGKG